LNDFIKAYSKQQMSKETSDFVKIDVIGLAALKNEYGSQSKQHKIAQLALKEFIQKVQKNQRILL
jgi:hypothetical protein